MLQLLGFRLRSIINTTLLVSVIFLVKYLWSTGSPLVSDTMAPPPSAEHVALILLAKKGHHLQSFEVLQSLWAGYGKICRITATPTPFLSPETQSYILKLITPPLTKAHDEGHTRKILSYQVEQYFYTHLAPQLPPSILVAKVWASMNEHHADGTFTMATILNDLKKDYPIEGEKREVLNPVQVYAALDWLSGFHGFWWTRVKDMNNELLVRPPMEEVQRDGQDAASKTVWLNGGYTYLATRRKEYKALATDYDTEWNMPLTDWEEDEYSMSEIVASVLAPKQRGWTPSSDYMTLIHGDVKSENLFTSKDGKEVVFYDFQYTGLGLGVCDLAKLFTCSVPIHMLVDDAQSAVPRELGLQENERKLLERYWNRLKKESGKEYEWNIFVGHWETALVDWLRFQASWGFWGNTEWLEARVRFILKNAEWKSAVIGNAKMAGLFQEKNEF
jgi:hypothetical protein